MPRGARATRKDRDLKTYNSGRLDKYVCICYLTGGSAVGLSFSVGGQNVSVLSKVPPLEVLPAQLERILNGIKGVYLGRV